MATSSQSDIDALFGDSATNAGPSASEQTPLEKSADPTASGPSASAEDTVVKDYGQEKQTSAEKQRHGKGSSEDKPDPRGVPWVDFVPELDYRRPTSLDGNLMTHIANLNDALADKELLKLRFHNEKINVAYQALWVRDSNRILRVLVRTVRRREEIRANIKAQKQAAQKIDEEAKGPPADAAKDERQAEGQQGESQGKQEVG